MEPDRVSVSGQLMNQLLGYLSERPYREVAGLIAQVHNDLKPVNPAPTDDEESTP